MWNFLFVVESGEDEGYEFLVQCDTKEEAEQIAQEEFEGEYLKYCGRYTDYQAEMMGLDTF